MNRTRRIERACKSLQVSLALLALPAVATAVEDWQYYQIPEPTERSTWLPTVKYLKFDAEAEQSTQRASGSGSSTAYERIYFSPGIGIGWEHFIYHPDLMNVRILAEPGYRWQASGPSGRTQEQNDLLLNGTINATFLHLKPYSSTVFATASHDTHQYDFFNTVVEDAQSWGATTGYRAGPVPLTASLQSVHRDTMGFNYDTTSDQLTFQLSGRNERHRLNTTDFSYQFSTYDSDTGDGIQTFHDSTTFHYVNVTDQEHFGKSLLTSTLLLNSVDSLENNANDATLILDLSVQHTPHLRGLYNYSFAGHTTSGGDAINNLLRAGVQHELYESLNSSADVHGATADSSFGGSTLDLWSVGTSASIVYNKRLGEWGRLTLSESLTYDYTDQQTSGPLLLVPNESHTLLAGQWSRLNQPRTVAIISVRTDAAHGNVLLTENLDYIVDRTRDPWQIQINPFSIIIVSGDTVLVDYTVQPNPSGSYTVFSDQAQIRLDLWKGMVGLYARYNFTDSETDTPGFVLEDIEEFQAGADFSWRGLRLDANYTDRYSTLFDYSSVNFSETYTLQTSRRATLSVDFSQRWSFYPAATGTTNADYTVSFYNFIVRYDWHPFANLDWNVEAGYQQQRGNRLDEDLFVARSYLNWLLGKMEIHLGYDYQNQKYLIDSRERHFVFLRARRNF